MHYHGNCGVIQGFPALRKAVTTHVKKYVIFLHVCWHSQSASYTPLAFSATRSGLWMNSMIQRIFPSWESASTYSTIVIRGLSIHLFSFLNEVGFSSQLRDSCVYMINKIIHGCLKIWNFSSRVQLDISLVRCVHSWAIELHTEIPYLRAPMYYSLFIWWKITITRKKDYWAKISQPFGLQKL